MQGKDRRAVLLPNLRLGQRFLIRQHRLRVRAEAVVRLRRQRVFRLAARRFLLLCLRLRLLGLHQRKSLRQHAGNPHVRPGQTAVDQHHAQRHRLACFQAVRLQEHRALIFAPQSCTRGSATRLPSTRSAPVSRRMASSSPSSASPFTVIGKTSVVVNGSSPAAAAAFTCRESAAGCA